MEKNKATISYKTPLACSYYNQHCDGGYPELISKTAYDFGLTSTACEGTGEADSESATAASMLEIKEGMKGESKVCPSDCYKNPSKNLWYAKNYGYVGGFYGKCSEARVMNELLHRGPVPIAIEVGGNFDTKVAKKRDLGHHVANNDRSFVDVRFSAPSYLKKAIMARLSDHSKIYDQSVTDKSKYAQYLTKIQPGDDPHRAKHEDKDSLDNSFAIGTIRLKGSVFEQNERNGVSSAMDSALLKDILGHVLAIDKSRDNAVSEATPALQKLIQTADLDKVQIQSMTEKGVNSWEYVDHAVVIVGWGENKRDDGEVQKYWIVRNSWGPTWGPDNTGFAYIRRGEDEMGAETQVTFSDPDFTRGRAASIIEEGGLTQDQFWEKVRNEENTNRQFTSDIFVASNERRPYFENAV